MRKKRGQREEGNPGFWLRERQRVGRIAALWGLTLSIPLYELAIAGESLPVLAELGVAALVAVVSVSFVGASRWMRGLWIALSSFYGAIGALKAAFAFQVFAHGTFAAGLMAAAFGIWISWLMLQPEPVPGLPDQDSNLLTESMGNLKALVDRGMDAALGIWGLFIVASLLDALLMRRLFLLSEYGTSVSVSTALP